MKLPFIHRRADPAREAQVRANDALAADVARRRREQADSRNSRRRAAQARNSDFYDLLDNLKENTDD